MCIFFAIPIVFEAKASPLFWQWRVGQFERRFKILKLRTMRPEAPSVASHTIGEGYMLASGRLARAFKIDEVPQLWNVLKGEMSLVGPRPSLPSQVELINARRAAGVFALLPGITGVSQIQGLDMSHPQLLAQADADYLQTWKLMHDLKICFLTVIGRGRGDAAIENDNQDARRPPDG